VLKPRTPEQLSRRADRALRRYFVPLLRLERVVPMPFGQSLTAWAEVLQ
jgi:hypothetical protein